MFEFRPEFHIDLKLEVVWPKLKGAFKGTASALKGLSPFKGLRFERGDYPRLLARALLLLAIIAALVIALALLLKAL
jgi:hypothetical protein